MSKRFAGRSIVNYACCCTYCRALSSAPITLVVDASKAPTQNIVRTHEVIPVNSGPLTLYYPQWIPGEHSPAGPIQNVAELVITANGQRLAWHRDPANLFAFKLNVPSGVQTIAADFTYLGTTFGNYSSNRLASPNIFVIDWNQNLLYPSYGTNDATQFDPTLILPAGGRKFATALYDAKRTGNSVTWSTTSLGRLLDSPLDACENFRSGSCGATKAHFRARRLSTFVRTCPKNSRRAIRRSAIIARSCKR